MAELLQDRAVIPVTQVSGPTRVEADHIYIIPPGKDLAMRGETISCGSGGACGARAGGPVLPDAGGGVRRGCGGRGAVGDGRGRHGRDPLHPGAGGITVAQSPAEAEYDGMPVSAIATGLIDLVLPSARMPGELIRLSRRPHGVVDEAAPTPDRRRAGPGVRRVEDPARGTTSASTSAPWCCGVWIDGCASTTWHAGGVRSVAGVERAESQALLRDLLISVSSFFRDPEAFESWRRGARACSTGRARRTRCGSGWWGARRVRKCTRWPWSWRSTRRRSSDPPRIPDLRHRHRREGVRVGRAGLYTAAAVPPSRRSVCAVLHEGGRRVPDRQVAAGAGAVRGPQRAPRPAVLADRPDQLPEPLHLPALRGPGAGAGDVPLRVAARGACCSWVYRSRWGTAACSCPRTGTVTGSTRSTAPHRVPPRPRRPIRTAGGLPRPRERDGGAAGRAAALLLWRAARPDAGGVRAGQRDRGRAAERGAPVGQRRPVPAPRGG
jgi:hypothetical protein